MKFFTRDAKHLQMRSYGHDGIFTPKSQFVLCFPEDNGLVRQLIMCLSAHSSAQQKFRENDKIHKSLIKKMLSHCSTLYFFCHKAT